MRCVLLIVVALYAAMLSACITVVTDSAAKADAHAARGEWSQAESAYAAAGEENIAFDEWEYIVERRCHARTELTKRRIEELDKAADATFDDWLEARAWARRCPSFVEFEDAFSERLIQVSERAFKEEVEPLVASRRGHEALVLAAKYTSELPEDHPRRAWLEELRDKLVSGVSSGSQDGEVTRGVREHLVAALTGTSDALPVDEARSRVQGWIRSVGPVELDASCSADEPIEINVSGDKTQLPVDLSQVRFSDCKRSARVVTRVEEFEELETRTVPKRVERVIEWQEPETTTTVYRKCSVNTGACYTSGTSNSTKWRTRTEVITETIMVEEKVPVKVMREVKRAIVDRSARVEFVVNSRDGSSVETLAVTHSATGEPREKDLPDEALLGTFSPGIWDPGFVETLRGRVRGAALHRAQSRRQTALQSEMRSAFEDGDDAAGRELGLILWLTGFELGPDDARRIDRGFPFDVTALEPQAMTVVGSYEWAPDVVRGDYFEFVPRDSDFQGVVQLGYALVFLGMAMDYAVPETFVGQPDRSTTQLNLTSQTRYSLTTDDYHRGFGVLVGMGFDLRIGSRFGDDYQRVQELPLFVDEEREEETSVTFGMGANLVTMLGYRANPFALFAGVRPMYTSYKIGHFFSEGGSVPLSARLELRWIDRYPMILEAWWGDVLEGSEMGRLTQAGGSFDVPLSTNLWFRAAGAHHELPANFFGLYEQDDVYVERARTYAFSLGLTFGF